MQHRVFEMELAGRTLSLEVGKLAEQAGGSDVYKRQALVYGVEAGGEDAKP